MDEIFGGYAHIYHFDFEMLKILLTKWGFSKIKKSTISEIFRVPPLVTGAMLDTFASRK